MAFPKIAFSTVHEKANERSTFAVTCSFYDENGAAVTPDSVRWSLVDKDNSIINGRQDVAVAVPAESIRVVLLGDDLQLFEDKSAERRWLVVEAVYTSPIFGGGLPLTGQHSFLIVNLKKVV